MQQEIVTVLRPFPVDVCKLIGDFLTPPCIVVPVQETWIDLLTNQLVESRPRPASEPYFRVSDISTIIEGIPWVPLEHGGMRIGDVEYAPIGRVLDTAYCCIYPRQLVFTVSYVTYKGNERQIKQDLIMVSRVNPNKQKKVLSGSIENTYGDSYILIRTSRRLWLYELTEAEEWNVVWKSPCKYYYEHQTIRLQGRR